MSSSFYKVGDWDIIELNSGPIKLKVVPSIGGRIVEYSIYENNIFYLNEKLEGKHAKLGAPRTLENWNNYGGYKIWLAPQSLWGWPPPCEMDSIPWNYEIFDKGKYIQIVLNSPIFNEFKASFKRIIRFKTTDGSIQVEESVTNHNDKDVNWSIWDNSQVVSPGYAEVELNSDIYAGSINFYQEFDIPSNSQYKVLKSKNSKSLIVNFGGEEEFKLGTLTNKGQIKFYKDYDGRRIIYTKKFEFYDNERYPHGSTVEFYNNPLRGYGEVEVLSPVYLLKPQQSAIFSEVWTLKIEED